MHRRPRRQSGSSLIEVLVAVLILSFGLLSLGGMMAYAVQMPKLSGYRSTATMLAASHIESMRANPSAGYGIALVAASYPDYTAVSLDDCSYPACTLASAGSAGSIAKMDTARTRRALRTELPAGDMHLVMDPGDASAGNLWIVWQEPDTFAKLNSATSDSCPNVAFSSPKPRCLYVRFKLCNPDPVSNTCI